MLSVTFLMAPSTGPGQLCVVYKAWRLCLPILWSAIGRVLGFERIHRYRAEHLPACCLLSFPARCHHSRQLAGQPCERRLVGRHSRGTEGDEPRPRRWPGARFVLSRGQDLLLLVLGLAIGGPLGTAAFQFHRGDHDGISMAAISWVPSFTALDRRLTVSNATSAETPGIR